MSDQWLTRRSRRLGIAATITFGLAIPIHSAMAVHASAVVLVSDSFNRTVTGGWGTADTGGAWTVIDNPANWSVSPGAATVTVRPSAAERGYIGTVAVQDVDLLEKVKLPRTGQGNNNNELAYILGRYTGGSSPNYYRVGVGQGAGPSMILRAARSDGVFVGSDVNSGVPALDGAVVQLRVQFQGVNPTTIRARAWMDGATEPATWPLTVTDAHGPEQVAGIVGIRARNDDTATTHSFVYQGFQAMALSPPPPPTTTTTTTGSTTTTTTTTTPPTSTTSTTSPSTTSTTVSTPPPPGSLAADSYGRTASNGWGSTDSGAPWTVVGTPSNWSVGPGAGKVTVGPNAEERGYLGTVAAQDVDVVEKVALPTSTQPNTNEYGYVLARYAAVYAPTYYRVGVGQGPSSGSMFLRAQRSDGTVMADIATNVPAADGAVVWLHVQLTGVNPTTIRARAWKDGTPEPALWSLATTDSNAAEQGAGLVGIRARSEDTAASHTFTYGSFRVTGTPAPVSPPTPPPADGALHHYMYVHPDGELDVYDMDNNQALVKRVPVPTSGAKGMFIDHLTGMLYISECGTCSFTSGQIVKYNLANDTIVWIAQYPFGVDSISMTPDGRTIYSPDGEGSSDNLMHVIDAVTGLVKTSITINLPGHNSIVGLSGTSDYVNGFAPGANSQYLLQISTATNAISQKIGPFVNTGRPFTLNGKETLAFVTANLTLGFQVASITTGKVLYTVTPKGFTWSTFPTAGPSHGISLSPDEKEIYLMDGPNDYVHVFDVSGLPNAAPVQVADIPLSSIAGLASPCSSACEREGWLLHSRDGRFVYVGDTGDVISTATRTMVAHLAPLANTRRYAEVDWQNGAVAFAMGRYGMGYVTS